MRPGQPSRTMVNTAVQRAAHQVFDEHPLILVDPIAVGLVPEASEERIRASAIELQSMKVNRASMALRNRFAEDRLAVAVQRGVRQYVIAAAGLDTFPWRQPAWANKLRIFFADLPHSLSWARAQFCAHDLHKPANTTFVPIDLETKQPGCDLVRFGLVPYEPVFVSALGIVQFLTSDSIDALLSFVASSPAGSEIVLSCHPSPESLAGAARTGIAASIERGTELGEPWLTLTSPAEMIERLRRAGFRTIEHLSAEAAQERYFAGRKDGLKASAGLNMIAAGV